MDIYSVIEALRQQFSENILNFSVAQIKRSSNHQPYQIQSSKQTLLAQTLILTAGEGNEKLLNSLAFTQPKMQRRPLLMPMLKANRSILPKLYAHCLGVSALPKMTITSHTHSKSQQTLWYLGGEIAEQGVGRSIKEQTLAAQSELHTLMPWMDFSQCQWSALAIDRAEPKMPDNSRPIEPAVFQQQSVISAWPIKLAMTPIMVDKIMLEIEALKIKKNTQSGWDLPLAHTSPLPWQKVEHWL